MLRRALALSLVLVSFPLESWAAVARVVPKGPGLPLIPLSSARRVSPLNGINGRPGPLVAVPSVLVPASPVAVAAVAAAAPVLAAAQAAAPVETQAAEAAVRFDQALVRRDAELGAPVLAPASADEPPRDLAPASPEGNKEPGAQPPAPRRKLPRSLWGLFFGHHITTVAGQNFHIVSQSFLVTGTLGMSAAALGLIRNVHMGGMAIANALPIGALIDRTDYRVVYAGTTIARAVLMGAIPVLFLAGSMGFVGLAVIVGGNAWYQNAMLIADAASRRSFLGRDEQLNKDAAATLTKWDAVAGFLMPVAAGLGVGALVTSFGPVGYAVAYAVYSGALLVSLPIYWKMVRDPRFPENDAMGLGTFAVRTTRFIGTLTWTLLGPISRLPLVLLRGLAALPGALRRAWRARGEKAGPRGTALERATALLDRYESTQGLAVIARSKVLRILTSVLALEMLLIDALPFIILPAVLAALGTPPAWAPAFLVTEGGLLGLLFGIEYLGRLVPSMRLEGEKGDKIIEKRGHGSFYRRAAVASLLFWALLAPIYLTAGNFLVNLAIVSAVLFGVQLFHAPVGIVIEPVKRKHMDDDKLGRIESAIFAVDVAFESVGAVLLGLVLTKLGLGTAAIVVALFMTATAVVQYNVPKWIFPDGNRPAPDAPPKP